MTTARDEAGGVAVRRRHRSPLREQQTEQTRRAVVQAAHDLFVANGWAATGMREVAATAGVVPNRLDTCPYVRIGGETRKCRRVDANGKYPDLGLAATDAYAAANRRGGTPTPDR